MNGNGRVPAWVGRLVACLGGGVVLAMMVGDQEGSQNDYGLGFRESVLHPRIFLFLGIGVAIFLAITFSSLLVPYLARPGLWPLLSGALAVVAAQGLMHWNDQVASAKFTDVADAVAKTPAISGVTAAFFGWLAWTQLAVVVAAGVIAIVARLNWLAYAVAAVSVVAAIICYHAHDALIPYTKSTGPDHSLGYAAAILGYLVIVVAMVTAAMSGPDGSRARDTLAAAISFRPGLPLVVIGLAVAALGFVLGTWFSPGNKNLDVSGTHDILDGSAVSAFSLDYLDWLGWVLLAAAVVLAAAAALTRRRVLALAGMLVGAAGVGITLYVLYDISKTGADAHNFDGATGPWQNLGAGGWMVGAGFFLLAAAGLQIVLSQRSAASSARVRVPDAASGRFSTSEVTRTAIMIAAAAALFYPPTATPFWQQVFVSEIGISMLLAVGLNVVVGWAGLLDLGFIAFYAIGSYTTAYLVGVLPKKPPSWLELSPLWAIPFAIAICLLAGLALGAPTLRLRGDYLAIVTLGFGEIIRIIANNADSVTKGPQGPNSIPNPVIHIGPLHIRWGLNQLQYWYLLLVIFVIIVLAFRRLEHSRLGRAWAAVREDEVAAQATGINTTNVKLLAFAIGASTSGIAGVFFATQVGSFTPDNFVLNNSILIVAYVVFGGMGSLSGAMAGAAMLTWLPRFLQDQVPQADKLMWIGAVVIAMMIFRPAGLVPARRRQIEMHGLDDAPAGETRAVPVSAGM